jgi:hypothetical protein
MRRRRLIGGAVAVLAGGWTVREILDTMAAPDRPSVEVPPRAGAVTLAADTDDGRPGVRVEVPVEVSGLKYKRVELTLWFNYRNGGKVMARTPRGAYAAPNGQLCRMQFWHPRWQVERSMRSVFFPAAEFPVRDLRGDLPAAAYDVVLGLQADGREFVRAVRVPVEAA